MMDGTEGPTPMDCARARQLRHLYLDGELDPTEASRLEAHLQQCTDCTALFAQERKLSAAVKRELSRHAAPLALRQRVQSDIARHQRRQRFSDLRLLGVGWNPVAIAASVMLAIVTSSAVTTSYLSGAGEEPLAQQVVASHIRSLMADHLTDVVSSDQHTVKPWFNGKLDISPPVVDLAAAGFPLIGGRLDYVDRRPVAALVYRHQQHVINVMVWPESAGKREPAAAFEQQGYNVIHLNRGDMSLWVVSDLNQAELRDFVTKLTEATPDKDQGSGS
jgi:anti-sigma factor (TIGR02949 family)